jgi:hypothetical protein
MATTLSIQLSSDEGRKHSLELPEDVTEDDEVLLLTVLSALCSMDLCSRFCVQLGQAPHEFQIRGTLHPEHFEVGLDDMQFMQAASPLRVEHVMVVRRLGVNEVVLTVLSTRRRLMVTGDVVFRVTGRQRSGPGPQPPPEETTDEEDDQCCEFELPEDLSHADEILLTSLLRALVLVDICSGYQVQKMPPHAFQIRGMLHDESFEVGLDQLQFIRAANPLRVDHILVSRCGGANELVLKVLNAQQRVLTSDESVVYVTTRKRKACQLSK